MLSSDAFWRLFVPKAKTPSFFFLGKIPARWLSSLPRTPHHSTQTPETSTQSEATISSPRSPSAPCQLSGNVPAAPAQANPSPPAPLQPLRGHNSRLALARGLLLLGSCHRTARSEPAHCWGGLLLEVDLINAWAMRFLGLPLIPPMQIGRSQRAALVPGLPGERGACGEGMCRSWWPRCSRESSQLGVWLCSTCPFITHHQQEVFFCRESSCPGAGKGHFFFFQLCRVKGQLWQPPGIRLYSYF